MEFTAKRLNDLKIIKRDGREVAFDKQKIYNALLKATKEVHGEITPILNRKIEEIIDRVVIELSTRFSDNVKIYEIQNIVEHTLIDAREYELAQAYVNYRIKRDVERSKETDIDFRIKRLINKDKLLVNENANKDSNIFNTQRDLTAGSVGKAIGLKMLPPHVANAHQKGDIHYHDLDYHPYAPLTNCFARETAFVTKNGVKTFKDYEDGDKVTVLTPDGNWKNATVHNYGEQEVKSIIFRKGCSAAVRIRATKNHRWLLDNGKETTALAVGDKLRGVAEPNFYTVEELEKLSHEDKLWWVRGFVHGDGSTYATNGSRIRLCGNKTKYKELLLSVGYRVSSENDYLQGDVLMTSCSEPKITLTGTETERQIEMYIIGLLDADGSFRNGNEDYKSIITLGKKDSIDMFRKLSAVGKYHVIGEDDLSGQVTNYAVRGETSTFRLAHGNYFTWKVIDIMDDPSFEDVWCLEVEDEHAFVLEHGIPTGNCCLIDFQGMLSKGFKIGNADVEPPKSIQTATAQISQIIANVASSQYGGCSANRIDEFLAPFAELNYQKHLENAEKWIEHPEKREKYAYEKTKKDIYDAMQSLEYEINTLFTSNGQTPFTSIGFGLGTSWAEREIQKAIFKIRIKGLGKEERTAIFPKLVFTLKRGLNLNPGDPNYDIKELALECATKRMYPDVLSYDKIVELTGSFKVPMGCRSFLQGWKDEEGNEVNEGRMNLGVVTLNLPRMALEAKGKKAKFWKLLEERLDIAKDAMLFRVKRCKEAIPANAPILYQYGAFGKRLSPQDSVDEVFKNKRATISLGYIGLYEVATAFYGGEWENNPEAKEFTVEIMKTLKAHTDKWGNTYGYHFSVYGTPSESLTDRFSRLDRKKFGVIKDITDKEYYTNSFHYDVRKDPTPFEKLEFESVYAKYTSGGFIHYCEYPVLQQNPKALEAVWDFAYDKIGYLGTNTPIDHCYECGFEGDFKATENGFECPNCGNHDPKTADVVKRTCGYLGNPQQRPMAHGRHKEIASRVKNMPEGRTGDERKFDQQEL